MCKKLGAFISLQHQYSTISPSYISMSNSPIPLFTTTSHHHRYHHPLSSFLLLLLFTISTVTATATTAPDILQKACKATRYPTTCQTTLLHHPLLNNYKPITPSLIIRAALSLSSHHLLTAVSMSTTILHSFPHHRNRSMAARTCLDLLSMSRHRCDRTRIALDALHKSRDIGTPLLKDARAWVSAALTYQYDCWSELSYVNGTLLIDQTMSFLNFSLMPTTSNALSMMMSLDNYGDDVARWGPPRTERDGFWEKDDKLLRFSKSHATNLHVYRIKATSGERTSGSMVFIPEKDDENSRFGLDGLRFKEGRFRKPGRVDAVVCKGAARGCYTTVQKAVDAAPGGLKGRDRFVIYVKEGVYEEIVRVPLEKTNLVFLGDGMGKTVITASVNTGILGISTYNTATVGVKGDGFMASDITFENSAGANAHQAVAFRSDSDFSLVQNCEFLSNQDTLYAHSLRQVYVSCNVEGNVDFIFGNAAALFQDCNILVRPRLVDPTRGENNAITAQGRTDPADTTGFVFLGCHVDGTPEYLSLWRANPKVHRNYLGRPWKMYSRTVFIGCAIQGLISPDGWMPFRDGFALSTLYYGEFGNKGSGADVENRVNWSSRVPVGHLSAYSAKSFIQADEWNSVL